MSDKSAPAASELGASELGASELSATASSSSVLITGAGGLLGRTMRELLSKSGWRVAALTHGELDITRESDVMLSVERARPRYVINCVATGDVDRCEREPDWAFSVNADGPRLLARACRESGAELVHVSTDYVFDGSKSGFYTQQDEPNPVSVYGESKLAGEQYVRQELESSYVVRTSWLFGFEGKNFGSCVIRYAREGRHLKGVTDQTSIPTYAPDLARRIVEIIDLGVHELYQVTNTGATSWHEFAQEALELAGLGDTEIEPVTRASLNQLAPRPHNSAMRCLVSDSLGLKPLRHWREALEDFVRELQKRES